MKMQLDSSVKSVCVIGAGTMGCGIAAHLANVGFRVTLLDQTQEAVIDAFDRAKAARPPHFFVSETANEIRLGNMRDSSSFVGEADWVIEAIIEKADAKAELYAQIEGILRPDAFVSTNTSGLEISRLIEGRTESFRRRFLGTHFFNPPRYLKLVELIPTAETDPAILESMTRLLENQVGKRVILAKDTPGFIANRYGMWCMFRAIHVAEKLQLSVEEVDLITGEFLGRPRSGSFRLNDIVGLDVMRDVAANLQERCPDDPYISNLAQPVTMHSLLARNWIGEKVGQGYYRREGKEFLSLELGTLAYRYRREPHFTAISDLASRPLGERLRLALELRDPVGEFLGEYLVPSLKYAAYLREEISHSVQDFDRVMEWGFGWSQGPFKMIDAIGADRLGMESKSFYVADTQLGTGGIYVPIRNEPEFRTLAEYPILGETDALCRRDLGDGIEAISLKTKLGIITREVVDQLTDLLEKGNLDRFVLTSEAPSFSVGFDLKMVAAMIASKSWVELDTELAKLQRLGELLERTSAVAAVRGYCLGAGLELALSCAQIVALADAQLGLPEAKVGLVPGGRGTALVRLNNQTTAKRLADVALMVTRGEVAASADLARDLGYLRMTDITVYHPDRLISEAKRVAMISSPLPRPAWSTESAQLVGMIDRSLDMAQSRGQMTEYDVSIGHKIKQIFGRSSGYEDALARERTEFLDLCGKSLTEARIRHMLENGRPLRN